METPLPRRESHPAAPDTRFDGGSLDCGNGLLLLIRRHIDPLPPGGLLEILSTESSVEEDLPSWCRLTGNELVSLVRDGPRRSFLVCKGSFAERRAHGPLAAASRAVSSAGEAPADSASAGALPPPAPVPPIPPLSVMGIGSWPRPRWMLRAIHDRMEGRMAEEEFQAIAEDATRLAVEAQVRAGADVVTDGEQRRDSYASFVGGLLENCQLIPLTDLLPLVDDPAKFEEEMRSLDVPASQVRHPAVFGRLARRRPLALEELASAKWMTGLPVKVALPGPYLLTRTMWMECISDKAYRSREELSEDVVKVLREELHHLLAAGASLVQFDEPVLTEVVYSGPRGGRSFMCGALSEKGDPAAELDFAVRLLERLLEGVDPARTALHVCRGNWTRDERAALVGDYRPLLEVFQKVRAGTFFLELCTPRAGEMEVLREIPAGRRIGVGVVNQKLDRVETPEEIAARARRAIDLFGAERVLLNPDCGFATFADSPIASAAVAEAKLRAIAEAACLLRKG